MRAGDRAAFGELVDRYLLRALAVARRLLRHREDAEDLVQDAFLSALEHIDRFDAARPFWPWFSRILVNRGLDIIAARAGRVAVPLSEAIADARGSPAEAVERDELVGRVRHLVATLPPRRRLVLQLFELDGLTVAEIAELLDTSPTTVRWHLHMTRRRLRSELSLADGGAP